MLGGVPVARVVPLLVLGWLTKGQLGTCLVIKGILIDYRLALGVVGEVASLGPDLLCLGLLRDFLQLGLVLFDLALEKHLVRLDLMQLLLHSVQMC